MKTFNWKSFLLVLLSVLMVVSLFACGDGSDEDTAESRAESNTESEEKSSVSEESAESDDESSKGQTEEKTENTEPESSETKNTETDEPETDETEKGIDVVSFVDYFSASVRAATDLKTGPFAVSFTVPADSYLNEFYLNLTNEAQYTTCAINVNIYKFNGDYNESIATEPVYNKLITSTLKSTTLSFKDKPFGAGDYLVVVSCSEEAGNDSSVYTSVMVDNAWNAKSVPEQYAEYNMKSYINGKQKNHSVMCCAMAIDRYIPVVEPEEDKTPNTNKDDDNVAKVILLSGQSNAAGVSQISILQNKIGAEEFEKYKNGFPNVKILYKNGNQDSMMNSNFEFVDVKLGQGIDEGSFGPEIGLAAYLSEAYPDETFYIIKYGVGGTNLYSHWSVTDPSRSKHADGFKNAIDEGIDMLEEDGLTPKIIGWLWMQGESDSTQFYHAHEYYNREKALVENIREEYADYASSRGIAFIDAATGNTGFFASWFLVNDMKLKYSKESCDNYYIDTISYGLTTLYENNDLAHYDSMSMLVLGRLFGDKLSYALNNGEDDDVCPHKSSALKADKNVHFTECEFCKVRMTEEAHVPGGTMEYDAETKSYKGACACGAFTYSDLYYDTEARVNGGGCEDVTNSAGSDDSEAYFVRYTPTADKRARIYIVFGNKNVTGQYMVLKYRLVNNGNSSALNGAFAATTASSNPMARGNGDECGTLGALVGDGEWHYLVVDLVAKNKENGKAGAELQFKADANGNYAVSYIRADFVLQAYDGSCYLDIASVGFADQYDAVSKFVEVCPHTEYNAVEYDAVTKSYNTDSSLTGAFAATTASSNPMARGNGDDCGTLGTLIGDGEWHYLVVDLVAKNTAAAKEGMTLQYMADANGDYACNYIRADFLLQAYDGSCYLDIASVGFAG